MNRSPKLVQPVADPLFLEKTPSRANPIFTATMRNVISRKKPSLKKYGKKAEPSAVLIKTWHW
jgi:hypothetical protein